MQYLIKRNIIKNLKKHIHKKEITLITGARQTGKTTLIHFLKNELDKKGEKTIFLNLDFESDKEYFSLQEKLINKLKLEFGNNKAFIFIDEFQRKENAGLFLKGIYDMELPYKFIISGSGSLELKEKIHESLLGRKKIFELMPVSFQEFTDFKTNYKYSDRLDDFYKIEFEKSNLLLNEYLNFGGYPRVITSEQIVDKRDIINEISQSYLEKDISYLLNISRPDIFNIMIKLLADQTGKIINYAKLSKDVGISLPTLKKYLWYAEKTFSINIITPYFKNYHKEIRKAPCVYFNDIGFRNFMLNSFGFLSNPNQLGFVFQNFVYNLLKEQIQNKGYILHYWRTTDKTEVDFVIDKGNEIVPIEVKFSNLKNTLPKRSIRSFIDKYNPKTAIVINLSLLAEININGTTVKFLPFYQLGKANIF